MPTITEKLGMPKYSYIPKGKRQEFERRDPAVVAADIRAYIKDNPGKVTSYKDMARIAGYASTTGFMAYTRRSLFQSTFTIMRVNNTKAVFSLKKDSETIVPAVPDVSEERLKLINEQAKQARAESIRNFREQSDRLMWDFIKSIDPSDPVVYQVTPVLKAYSAYLDGRDDL